MTTKAIILGTTELHDIVSKAYNIGYVGISGLGWAAYFSILRLYGKRVTEVITLRTRDVYVEGKYLCIRFAIGKSHRQIKPVRTKKVKLDNPYAQIILEYLETVPDGFLFPSTGTKTGHIYRQYAHDACKMIRDDMTNHTFRHTLATQLAERRFTAFELQSFFDWQKLETASEYVKSSGVMSQRISDYVWEAEQ